MKPKEVYEVAQLHIRADALEAFVAAAPSAEAALKAAPGCVDAHVLAGIENPGEPLLMVHWESVAAHEAFRDSLAFAGYRATIQDHFAAPPTFRHYEVVGG